VDLEIREATVADTAMVSDVMRRFFEEEGLVDSVAEVAERAPRFLEQPGNKAYIALQGGEPIGVVAITTTYEFETGWGGRISDMYIRPERRGTGIADRLLEAAIEWCRSVGCGAIQVDITPESDRTHGLVGFYEVSGFWTTSRIVMERLLS
jgi:GNAT superfamily N-acetyltransferase